MLGSRRISFNGNESNFEDQLNLFVSLSREAPQPKLKASMLLPHTYKK